MFNLVNGFGGQNQQVRQNPDEYAKQYAEQNGLSFEEAKAELKSKYGDPQQQNNTSSLRSFCNYNMGNQNTTNIESEIASLRDEIASLEEILFGKSESTETTTTNSSTNIEETTTSEETSTVETTTNRIKEYDDQTLYKYLKNERGLSDDEIANISEDSEKQYKKELQQHIDWNKRKESYYANQE